MQAAILYRWGVLASVPDPACYAVHKIEAMQKGLDAYLVGYINERLHQGRGMKGRTPVYVFVRCLPKPKTPKEQKMKKAAGTKTPPGPATVGGLPYLYTPSYL